MDEKIVLKVELQKMQNDYWYIELHGRIYFKTDRGICNVKKELMEMSTSEDDTASMSIYHAKPTGFLSKILPQYKYVFNVPSATLSMTS